MILSMAQILKFNGLSASGYVQQTAWLGSASSLKKFILHLLLPYILIGCSRDGPPYLVDLELNIQERGRSITPTHPMKVGVYREGGLPPFDKPVLWTHLITHLAGPTQIRLELPQPAEYYRLRIDSLPAGYSSDPQGVPLSHKQRQSLTLFVVPP